MNLYYFKDQYGNFGDDLNPWIWYSLYPEIFQSHIPGTFLGVGTLINDKAPSTGTIYVGGSGVGYHGKVQLSDRWKFVFVRGPKSAQALGLSSDLAITDPAILISQLVQGRRKSFAANRRVSFMPHHASSRFADWRSICRKIDVDYLDPADNMHETVLRISNSSFVICEAMHAAIVADALRVPWMPVKCYPHILDFKWQDWCESLGLAYVSNEIDALWDAEQFYDAATVFKSRVKHKLLDLGLDGSGWTPPIPKNNSASVLPTVMEKLNHFKTNPSLLGSTDETHATALRRTRDCLDAFSSSLF